MQGCGVVYACGFILRAPELFEKQIIVDDRSIKHRASAFSLPSQSRILYPS